MNKDSFFDFLTAAHLYWGASVFAAITVTFVVLIYANLHIRKKRYFSQQDISDRLNNWIGEALVDEVPFKYSDVPWLDLYLKSNYNRQHVTDCLINLRKNLNGAASDRLISIYEELGLQHDARTKLRSRRAHIKCRGIYELYMMRQQDAIPEIEQYLDSPVTAVRMEAQTAFVGFFGFKGLSFLSAQTYPLNDWQQLKLLEQLRTFPQEELPDLVLWLRSANDYVKRFALKLADIYQKLEVHNIVVICLSSIDERVRYQAITTLGRIANEKTAAILTAKYAEETLTNKANILRQLAVIGTESDVPFLIERLREQDDNVKLEAGRAIARCVGSGIDILDRHAAGDETLISISKQIKYELAL